MNKNDIKNSINAITPDPHLKTRLKANSQPTQQQKITKKLVASTMVICCVLAALAVGIGFSLAENNNQLAELPANHANNSYSKQNANDYIPETTQQVTLSPEELAEELSRNQEIIVHPENNQVAVSTPFSAESNTDKKLIVKGKDISDNNYFQFYKAKNYVELPFMAVLNEIADAEIVWTDDTAATLTVNGTEYNLNVNNKCVLTEKGKSENLFTPSSAIGDAPVYRFVDNQLIIDDSTIAGFLNSLGYSIVIDYDAQTINIL